MIFSIFKLFIITIFGAIFGLVTGIIPVLHPNNIIAILYGIHYDNLALSVFAISMLLTFSFSSIIPTILLGYPEGIESLALPPTLRLIKEGKAYEVFLSTLYGSLLSVPISLILMLTLPFVGTIYYILIKTKLLAFILILLLAFIVAISDNILGAILVILLSGLLGILVSKLYVIPNKLTALFTGLFGLPFIFTLNENEKPKVIIEDKRIIMPKAALAGSLAAYLSLILPTVSPAISIFLFQTLLNINDAMSFVYAMGALTTADVILSLGAFYFMNRARNGAIVFVKYLFNKISFSLFLLLLVFTFISVFLAFYFTKEVGKRLFKYEVNLAKYKYHILALLLIYIFLTSGLYGIILSLTAMILGLIAIELEINFSLLTSVLTIPFILSLLGVL